VRICVYTFHAITKEQHLELGNRPIINAEASEGVDNMEWDGGRCIFCGTLVR